MLAIRAPTGRIADLPAIRLLHSSGRNLRFAAPAVTTTEDFRAFIGSSIGMGSGSIAAVRLPIANPNSRMRRSSPGRVRSTSCWTAVSENSEIGDACMIGELLTGRLVFQIGMLETLIPTIVLQSKVTDQGAQGKKMQHKPGDRLLV